MTDAKINESEKLYSWADLRDGEILHECTCCRRCKKGCVVVNFKSHRWIRSVPFNELREQL